MADVKSRDLCAFVKRAFLGFIWKVSSPSAISGTELNNVTCFISHPRVVFNSILSFFSLLLDCASRVARGLPRRSSTVRKQVRTQRPPGQPGVKVITCMDLQGGQDGHFSDLMSAFGMYCLIIVGLILWELH